jgi:hypothetical protein
MSDYFQQFSFAIRSLTPEECVWMKTEYAKKNEDNDESYQSAFTLHVEEPGDLMKDEPEGAKAYLYCDEQGDLELTVTFVQDFLKANRPLEYVCIEWADWCSRPRTDSCGGGAILVTADNAQWASTTTTLDSMLKDPLRREGPAGSENYELKDPKTGSGVWIRVRDLMVHVLVTDDGVVTDIYTEGNDSTQDPKISDEAVASTYAFFGETV